MKKIFFTLVFLCLTLVGFAQKVSMQARVVDAATDDAIPGAVVSVEPKKHTHKKRYTTTDHRGNVRFENLDKGAYTLQVNFTGYSELKMEVVLNKPNHDLGALKLKEGVLIETVVKEVRAMRTSQKGDTLSYNASAFKVVEDADVAGLLKKMPGITITDGKVEAQGEEVKKVLVDGKEFFGEDVTTAIKSLPAEAVDRIDVFNKLSDAAEFSGMDDGEGYKALNIVTRMKMRQGQFGKVYMGAGFDVDTKTEDKFKYLAGGNVNLFNNDSRLSVIALFNNVNQQDFSFEDILGVMGGVGGARGGRHGMGRYMMRPQSGVATVNAFGVNYSNTWGKQKNLSFQGSYFFNNTHTINRAQTDKWYEAPMYHEDTLQTHEYSNTLGYNHRMEGRLEWKISKNQNLMIRPRFSYQSNDPLSHTWGWLYGAPEQGGSGYSRTNNFSDKRTSGYNLSTYLVYRAKLGKDGRTITLDGWGNYADNRSNSTSWSNRMGAQMDRPMTDPETGEWDEEAYTDLRYLYTKAPTTKYGLNTSVAYTEPLAKNWAMSLQYRFTFNNEERDKNAFNTGEDFGIEGLSPDPRLSDSYRSRYTRHRVGPGIRYSQKRNTFVANVYYQNSELTGLNIQGRQVGEEKIHKSFDDVTYFMMTRMNFNPANSLRLFISSYTSQPAIADLQNVYDVTSAQHITHGNTRLNPAYTHSIRFHYTHSNVEKGRTFMWMTSFQAIQDFNATHTVQQPGAIQIEDRTYTPNYYSTPVNLDGYRRLYTQVNYGFPVGFLKSNLNLKLGLSYSAVPSMLGGRVLNDGSIEGGVRTDTHNIGYMSGAVLGSNISEKVDFTLSWNGTYNEATNDYNGEKIKNRYFNHAAEASMKFVLPLGFTFTGSFAYRQYLGFTDHYDDNYMLCNVWIGKKIFKNRRGEVMFGVNDLLNQNRGFVRTTDTGWSQNTLNSVIGRYYMFQFTYNLRRFGKNGSHNLKDYEGMSPQRGHGRGMSHGSGMGHGHYRGMF